ncbi:MAG TPA: PRC-barrel domain-containing protein [Burkholderiales bacterium]
MKTMKSLLLGCSLIAFAGASLAAGEQQSSAGTVPVSKLQDMKVLGTEGKQIGEVSDVVLNLANQKVHAIVVQSGGMFGVGGNNYAFPISDFSPGKESNQISLNVSKEELESKKGFAKSQWPGMDDQYWSQAGSGAAAGGTQEGGRLNLVRASELEGKQVQAKGGEEVGKLKDLTVSMSDGRIRDVVIDLKDGGQARLPAKQLSSGTNDRLVVAMDAQQIRSQAKQSGGQSAGTGSSARREQQPPQQQKY